MKTFGWLNFFFNLSFLVCSVASESEPQSQKTFSGSVREKFVGTTKKSLILTTDIIDWKTAGDVCKSFPGTSVSLFTPENEEESLWLANTIREEKKKSGVSAFWVGLEIKDGEKQWVTGTAFTPVDGVEASDTPLEGAVQGVAVSEEENKVTYKFVPDGSELQGFICQRKITPTGEGEGKETD